MHGAQCNLNGGGRTTGSKVFFWQAACRQACKQVSMLAGMQADRPQIIIKMNRQNCAYNNCILIMKSHYMVIHTDCDDTNSNANIDTISHNPAYNK